VRVPADLDTMTDTAKAQLQVTHVLFREELELRKPYMCRIELLGLKLSNGTEGGHL